MRFGLANRPRWIPPVVAVLVASPLLAAAAEPETPDVRDPRFTEEPQASRPGVPIQAAPQPVREPAFELAGIVKLEGDASLALLQEPELTMGRPLLVRQGQSIGAYRLVAVEADRVRLESATGVVTVLFGGSMGGPDAVALVPPPKPEAEARPAPEAAADPPPNPAAAELHAPESASTAEESVEAAMKGTRGGKVLDMLKNAFGLGAKQ
jgi:hypothetical protein